MENVDSTYCAELNFVEEFNLSHIGMIKEIRTEFDIIRLCLAEIQELGDEYLPMLDRIIVMPLRKLLCENTSVLLRVCPNFRMPPLDGFVISLSNNQEAIRPPFKIAEVEEWITVDAWLKQNISWFNRDANNTARMIPKYSYDCITRKLNGRAFRHLKSKFESLYEQKEVEYKGAIESVYVPVNPTDPVDSQEAFNILEEIGYNKLSVYDFIKHISDKRGGHIDVGHSLEVAVINQADSINLTPVHYFALQMIYAAKKQILDLNDYWPEIDALAF